uniref:Uncharacterized protein n=1 Tax=Panagrolaimus davidi TaxID=227884 RepID=A0A914QRT8_9BILA
MFVRKTFTPSFAYSSNRSNTFDHSSPPNYYQLALQQEEENRHRQDLFSLIYSSSSPTSTSILLPPIAPPNHPPPSIPTNSTETTTFLETYYNNQQQQKPNQQKLRIDNSVILNNNLRPPSFKHLRSVSTDASFESRFSSTQRNFQESEERGSSEEFISDNTDKIDLSYCEDSFNDISIDLNNFLDNQIERMKPPLEMAKEKRKLVVLNDLEKSSKDFSLSG